MLFTSIAIVAALAMAPVQSAPDSSQGGNPPGSYQQTCSNISVKKGSLYARCQTSKGKSRSTRLASYETCGSDIVNRNGHLECAPHPIGSQSAAGPSSQSSGLPSQPAGSYSETCRDISMKGTTLRAVCKNLEGREAPTSLRDANRCPQGVINLNGILNCAVNDVLPPGSYLATCKDVQMQGTTLRASCNDGKDRWVAARLSEAQKCTGDISNQNGSLRCVPIKMEKR
ncbi:MAG TPA: CVNH domain-containing protein [Candidatus Angelobacter sp.]|nr:CVNH domain-containing protein [Candidatus Angelobacter sp.]